jgi:hypothetical protein
VGDLFFRIMLSGNPKGGDYTEEDVDEEQFDQQEYASPIVDELRAKGPSAKGKSRKSSAAADGDRKAPQLFKSMTVEPGQRVQIMVARQRGKATVGGSGVVLVHERLTVPVSVPNHRLDCNTICIWVPGHGPRMCSVGLVDDKLSVMVVPATIASRRTGMVKQLDARKTLPRADCEKLSTLIGAIQKLCGISDKRWIMRNGLNALLEAFNPEDEESWDHVFSPKTPAEADALVEELRSLGMLEVMNEQSTTALIEGLKSVMIPAEPAQRAAARPRVAAAAAFAGTTYLLPPSVPHMTLRMPREMAVCIDRRSSGEVTVQMTPGGAAVLSQEVLAAIRAAADALADDSKQPFVRLMQFTPDTFALKLVPNKAREGTAIVCGGQRFEGVDAETVPYYMYPSDIDGLLEAYPYSIARSTDSTSKRQQSARKVEPADSDVKPDSSRKRKLDMSDCDDWQPAKVARLDDAAPVSDAMPQHADTETAVAPGVFEI